MANIVVGTAGHIDHGKTTLIKALTGMETDTTKEEKKRGMSINLGFAYFDLPNGDRVGVVDVPGHEKFVKNMLAGSTGLNMVLLVIDANEGVMPQTKEHMAILSLLGIEDFIVVVTKIDMVDKELLDLVLEDIKEQLQATPLENAPILQVDSLTKKGLPELINEIQKVTKKQERTKGNLAPRLNVDRVFSLKGFGTIVTGTLLDGEISVGDELTVYPQDVTTRIRSIQVHETDVSTSYAGQRTALNLTNLKTDDLSRGDVLTKKNNVNITWMLNVKIKILKDAVKEMELWDRVRLSVGTKEVLARVVPLGVESIQPGEEQFAQLRLEEEVVVKDGDKFIIRSYSPVHTIGGGTILDSQPHKNKRYDQAVLSTLKVKEEGSLEDIIDELLSKQGTTLTAKEFIYHSINKENKELETVIQQMIASDRLIEVNSKIMNQGQYNHLKEKVEHILTKYHKTFRLRKGMTKEEFRSRLDVDIKNKELDILVNKMISENVIKEVNAHIAMYDFDVTYNKYNLKHKEEIEKKLLKAQFTPPSDEQLTNGKEEIQEVINSLVGDTIIRLDHQTVIHKQVFDDAVKKVKEYISDNGSMTLADFRDMTGSSRKYSMIILEYMDKIKVTKRVENTRELY